MQLPAMADRRHAGEHPTLTSPNQYQPISGERTLIAPHHDPYYIDLTSLANELIRPIACGPPDYESSSPTAPLLPLINSDAVAPFRRHISQPFLAARIASEHSLPGPNLLSLQCISVTVYRIVEELYTSRSEYAETTCLEKLWPINPNTLCYSLASTSFSSVGISNTLLCTRFIHGA